MPSIWKKLKNWSGDLKSKSTSETITRLFTNEKKSQPGPWKTLEFKTNGFLTLGTEIELQLIDPANGKLVPRAQELLDANTSMKSLHQELYKSTLEIVTAKCDNVHQIRDDLKTSIDHLVPQADARGIKFSSTGCHPFVRALDCEISDTPRYHAMIERNQWLVRHQAVYGLHVHIGMNSGDEAIRFCNFFLRFVPHLLALSASSPFVDGHDTGMSAFRPSTYEALPTAGSPYLSHSWQEFDQLCEVLTRAGAIESLKDLWWDIRPSPNYGTLEIRVCDGPATLAETTALVAFIHCLAAWFADNGAWLAQVSRPPQWLMRENKWRAMRRGLDASFVLNTGGETRPLRDELNHWLEQLQPYCARFGYGEYFNQLRWTIANGNSADRQRAVYTATGSMEAVVAHNIAEFHAQRPLPVPATTQAAI